MITTTHWYVRMHNLLYFPHHFVKALEVFGRGAEFFTNNLSSIATRNCWNQSKKHPNKTQMTFMTFQQELQHSCTYLSVTRYSQSLNCESFKTTNSKTEQNYTMICKNDNINALFY